jgi:hypothetical protein
MNQIIKSSLFDIMNSRYSERFGRALGCPLSRESAVHELEKKLLNNWILCSLKMKIQIEIY